MIFENIKYKFCYSDQDSFFNNIADIINQIDNNVLLLRIVFFSIIDSNEDFFYKKEIIKNILIKEYGINYPVFSLISQKPLGHKLVAEYCFCDNLNARNISHSIKSHENERYIVMNGNSGKLILTGGIQGDINDSFSTQSESVFNKMKDILSNENMTFNNILRQWNYIQDITKYELDNQYYQIFNNVRSEYYNQVEWTNGYPAATGIGMQYGGLNIEFDAFDRSDSKVIIKPIDNNLQISAHKYSEDVLQYANNNILTPKFERAKEIIQNNISTIYISGTASIRGEQTINPNSVCEQLKITLENINNLIGSRDISYLRIYLKNEKDYNQIHSELRKLYPIIPLVFVKADVCRNNLLIEIEGIANE